MLAGFLTPPALEIEMSARTSPRRELPARVRVALDRRRSSVTAKRDPRRSPARRTQRTQAITASIREAV